MKNGDSHAIVLTSPCRNLLISTYESGTNNFLCYVLQFYNNLYNIIIIIIIIMEK